MKFSRSTLALVALNVALAAVLSCLVAQRHRPGGGDPRVEIITNYVPVLKARSQPVTIVTNIVAGDTNEFRWAQLESEDYRAYITRLRAIGCPEQTIRDIIIADVDKLLAPRMLVAGGRTNAISYWQPIEDQLFDSAEQKEAMRRQRALDFEKREIIRELLGVDLVGERLRAQGQGDYYGERLGFLPEDKRARVRTLLDQFADQERELLEQQIENDGAVAATDELARVRQQKDAALAQVLTPEEREQYDLWFSPAAAATRESVYGLNATEDEFRKLYDLRREFAAKYGDGFNGRPDAAQEFNQAVRQALGDARYLEYARAQDPDYRDLFRVATRFKLNPEIASQLYSYKQPIEEEQARVEAEPSLTPEQKAAAYEAISQETQRAFREALGDKAFRHYLARTRNPWVRGPQRAAVAR